MLFTLNTDWNLWFFLFFNSISQKLYEYLFKNNLKYNVQNN